MKQTFCIWKVEQMSTAALEHSMDLTVPSVRSRLLQLAKNMPHYLFSTDKQKLLKDTSTRYKEVALPKSNSSRDSSNNRI